MFTPTRSYSGFSVDDIAAARQFYAEVLGLEVTDDGPGLVIQHIGGGSVLAYTKEDHQPATYTVFDFEVENIDEAVKSLSQSGIRFERYEGMPQDESGVMRGLLNNMGPDIAWFKDPSGNVLAVMQVKV